METGDSKSKQEVSLSARIINKQTALGFQFTGQAGGLEVWPIIQS